MSCIAFILENIFTYSINRQLKLKNKCYKPSSEFYFYTIKQQALDLLSIIYKLLYLILSKLKALAVSSNCYCPIDYNNLFVLIKICHVQSHGNISIKNAMTNTGR